MNSILNCGNINFQAGQEPIKKALPLGKDAIEARMRQLSIQRNNLKCQMKREERPMFDSYQAGLGYVPTSTYTMLDCKLQEVRDEYNQLESALKAI